MNRIIPALLGTYFHVLTFLFPKLAREQAFSLFSRVKPLPITDEGAVFFSRATVTYLEINGNKTVLHKWGHGAKTVMFLHGWMSHSQRWMKYVEALDPSEYSCYALDAPGHGQSEGRQLNLELYRDAFSQALEVSGEVDVLIAHSLGNLVAVYQYLYNPNTAVNSYVIMGSPSGMDAILEYFKSLLNLSPAMLKNFMIKVEEILKIASHRLQLTELMNSNTRPKLVIHDPSDDITPYAPIRKAVQGRPNVTLMETSGLDHTLRSEEVTKAVIKFIEEQCKKEIHVFERI